MPKVARSWTRHGDQDMGPESGCQRLRFGEKKDAETRGELSEGSIGMNVNGLGRRAMLTLKMWRKTTASWVRRTGEGKRQDEVYVRTAHTISIAIPADRPNLP